MVADFRSVSAMDFQHLKYSITGYSCFVGKISGLGTVEYPNVLSIGGCVRVVGFIPRFKPCLLPRSSPSSKQTCQTLSTPIYTQKIDVRSESGGDLGSRGLLNTGNQDRQNRSIRVLRLQVSIFCPKSSISATTRFVGKRQVLSCGYSPCIL